MGVDPGESQLPLHLDSHRQKGLPGSDTFLPVNAPQPVHLLGGGSGTSRVKRPGRVVPLDSWAPHGCCLMKDAQRLSAKTGENPVITASGSAALSSVRPRGHLSSEVVWHPCLSPAFISSSPSVCVCVSHSVVSDS